MIRFMILLLFCLPAFAGQPAAAKQYRGILTREAHFVNGLSAPVPMYAAQIEQESGWKAGITAWDGGKGLAQFMDGTAGDIANLYPEIGKPAGQVAEVPKTALSCKPVIVYEQASKQKLDLPPAVQADQDKYVLSADQVKPDPIRRH